MTFYRTPFAFGVSPGYHSTPSGLSVDVQTSRWKSVFHCANSRVASCLDQIIPEKFTGIMQCDSYGAYPAHARTCQSLGLAACWPHVRREFYEAKDNAPQ